MNDIPDWNDVTPEIRPIAKNWIEQVKENFENAGYEVSDIGQTDASGGIGWDIAVTTDDGETIVIKFEVVDSIGYEGKMLGYNVSVDAIHENGQILATHKPYNYTDDVWTTDIDELKERANNMPGLGPGNIM